MLKHTNILVLIICLMTGGAIPAKAQSLASISVMADNSMSLAVAEIARHYAARRNIVVNTSFSVPLVQELLIMEGGAADILITPQAQWIEELKGQGLIDIYSPTVVATNSLVLVGPLNSTLHYTPSADTLPTAAIIHAIDGLPGFVVGNPETLIEGGYSKEALRNLDPGSLLAPYTLYIKQLSQMFNMVTRHGAYGVFLYSSTINRTGFKLIGRLPQTSHKPIDYYAVVVAGENMDEARRFLNFLKSSEAKRVLKENGFMVK
jgi:molybdate transport system substrate-binding protein